MKHPKGWKTKYKSPRGSDERGAHAAMERCDHCQYCTEKGRSLTGKCLWCGGRR